MSLTSRKVFTYKVCKANGHSIQFVNDGVAINGAILSEYIRIEKFQGYSNGKGFQYYFTPKTKPTWSASPRLTGMFPTKTEGVFYGDYRDSLRKTLIMFNWKPEESLLNVILFPIGYYPMDSEINQIARTL